MPQNQFTLSSYDPVYAVCPEVRFPEEVVRQHAKRWLEINVCKEGEEPQLTDKWVKAHVKEVKNVEELLVHIRFNLYKDNKEVQQLADQDVICAKLAERLEQEVPAEIVEGALMDAFYRLDDMLRQNGLQRSDYCYNRGITEKELEEEVKTKTIQSLKEDTALKAYAQHKNYSLTPDDFYAIIPGDSLEEKAQKRKQIEADGRLAGMEEYAKITKALKEVMDNAMIKRVDDDSVEWVRYGDIATNVIRAGEEFPDSFIGL